MNEPNTVAKRHFSFILLFADDKQKRLEANAPRRFSEDY